MSLTAQFVLVNMIVLSSVVRANADERLPSFEAIPNFSPLSLPYDEPGGETDGWYKELPCDANRASVVVNYYRTNPDKKWKPLIKIALNAVGREAGPYEAVFAVIRGPRWGRSPDLFVDWQKQETNKQLQYQSKAAGLVDVEKPIKVDLAWTPNGIVTVSFNEGPQFSMRAIGPIRYISVSVSSAKVAFNDLKVGHSGPSGANTSCVS